MGQVLLKQMYLSMAKKLVDKCPVDIESYYSDYIDIKNKENTDSRYVGKER